jgi:hypothetical protein
MRRIAASTQRSATAAMVNDELPPVGPGSAAPSRT